MNLAIPPSVLVQSLIALVAGAALGLASLAAMHRAWRYHDHRSERDFLGGFLGLAVGAGWVALSPAIAAGWMFTDEPAQGAVQQLVVFVNAAVRIVVLVVGGHLLLEEWRHRVK